MSIVRKYRKFRQTPFWAVASNLLQTGERICNRRTTGVLVRSSAVGMLALVTGYGLLAGDHLTDPSSGARGLPAQVSSYFGYAAEQIPHHRPETHGWRVCAQCHRDQAGWVTCGI